MISTHWIGLLACALCASVASALHVAPFKPFTVNGAHPIDGLAIAIIVGISARTLWPSLADRGVIGARFSVKRLLPFAIALLGAKLNFMHVWTLSAQSLALSITCVLIALFGTEWICRSLGVSWRLSRLIAIGASICGGTAIAVTAPVLDAKEDETAFALTCVTLYGLLCIFVMPPLGSLFDFTQYEFGVWSGISVHATAQVLATAHSYGAEAGEVALVVKLARVLLLAPLLIGLRLLMRRAEVQRALNEPSQEHGSVESPQFFQLFPRFILAFFALSLANTYGLIPSVIGEGEGALNVTEALKMLVSALMLMAMAGVGLLVDLKALLAIGTQPLIAGLISTVMMASVSAGMIYIFIR
jgi:uncharacterized integral membrane protein (TIGR00698 family)